MKIVRREADYEKFCEFQFGEHNFDSNFQLRFDNSLRFVRLSNKLQIEILQAAKNAENLATDSAWLYTSPILHAYVVNRTMRQTRDRERAFPI